MASTGAGPSIGDHDPLGTSRASSHADLRAEHDETVATDPSNGVAIADGCLDVASRNAALQDRMGESCIFR